jgi:hypothetical protein
MDWAETSGVIWVVWFIGGLALSAWLGGGSWERL